AVAALWPDDQETESGTHRFRQLRYRLRQALSAVPGAPRDDGIYVERGTLRLDPDVIHSDAQEFLELVRTARVNPSPATIQQLERARALYAGDLLQGPDARRYAWVDERDESGVTLREHFRKLFQTASAKLAELYTATKRADAAIDVLRELADIDPADERLWRALFRLHATRRDRLALMGEGRRMRPALHNPAAERGEANSAQR